MTKIFDNGDLWIESFSINITINDAAQQYSSALLSLEKPGRYVGGYATYAFMPIDDNTEAISTLALLDQGSTSPTYGEAITGVILRIIKQAGTTGAQAVVCRCMVWLKK